MYDAYSVEVWINMRRIATHVRSYNEGYTTVPEHMPEKHRAFAQTKEYNAAYFLKKWRFRSKGPQKTDDYFGVKPPKKDPIINKKGRVLGSRASIFRSIATQLS